MSSQKVVRRYVIAGVCATVFLGLSACTSTDKEAPSTSTTTTTTTSPQSSAPAPAPTEKKINPTGGNLFTPDITAPGPPTPVPGNLPGVH
jgi:hypothetical protein